MKHSVLALTVTGLLAVGAGVAIAGLPATPPGDELVIREPTVTTTTTVSPPPATVAPIVTEPPSPTTPERADTTSTTASGDQPTSPADSTTTTVPVPELRSIAELVVATANATDVGGVAAEHRDALRAIGYGNVVALDAEASDVSAVHYVDGFEREAARLADDLGWGADQIAPMADMPTLLTDQLFELVVVIGQDRV